MKEMLEKENKDSLSAIEKQEEYAYKVRCILEQAEKLRGKKLSVCVITFGCQQNEADSEKLVGQAIYMGYDKTSDLDDADLIIYNTCAVREHAELRALSRTGSLKHLKKKNPRLIIGLWGCMVTQDHRMNDIKTRYPYVDFVAGTNMLHRLPEILYDVLSSHKRRYYVTNEPADTVEGIPVVRENDIKAYVSIMYGCNNFCTYCVVPYVRGRERSRSKNAIIDEVRQLVYDGYRDITLLGQNVNSYRDPEYENGNYGFPELLSEICSIDGDFKIRFMTSHPKDASDKLIDLMAHNSKLARHFHLPMQSGSSDILRKMNRKYSAEEYLQLALKIKEKVPGIALTTDIIVGFPGETEKDFECTLDMVRAVRFDSIFAFIYSPRVGTPASKMDDPISHEEKTERMARLLELQTEISAEINKNYVGKTITALCESHFPAEEDFYTARTSENKIVFFKKFNNNSDLYGKTIKIEITRSTPARLYGEYSGK